MLLIYLFIHKFQKRGIALIFHLWYLNGKRNGKGKEFNNNCKLEFDGKYLKGERYTQGKEYYNNGELKFEGEYLNGKKIWIILTKNKLK